MARVDPRAAVHDRAFLGVDTDLLEAAAQLFAWLEPAVLLQVAHERRVAGAGDVAGLGVDGLLLAAVPLARARVDHGHTALLGDLVEVEDPRSVGPARPEAALANVWRGSLERLAPGLQAAVEHRLALVPEPAQQKPNSCGHRAPNVVIDDHGRRVVDARHAYRGLELLEGGQRVPAWPFARDVVELDERRAGDVPVGVLLRALAADEVPAEVDDANVGIPDVIVQPVRADQRTECAHECCPATRVS